ncbi:MAG: hypothetical protein OXQ89_06160 [Rhodospirillaceae bacterium]|nr:hypothetical protein [Rhodospirillaceae bacterium]
MLALVAHFFWIPDTVLPLAIAFIAIGLTDIVFPGSAGVGSHWFVVASIAAVLRVGMFFLPSWTLVALCRNKIPDWITSLLIVGWMVVYVSLFALFPLPEPWP